METVEVMHTLKCSCGSEYFINSEPTIIKSDFISAQAVCANCSKQYVQEIHLKPFYPENVRDAGPTSFAGRKAGLKHEY